MVEAGSFQKALVRILAAYPWRSRLSMADLSVQTDIPQRTLANWKEGRVRKPRHWQDILKLAAALRCSEAEADELLTSATHPTIAKLWDTVTEDEDKSLLASWPRPKIPFRVKLKLEHFAGREKEKNSLKNWLVQPEYHGPFLLSGMPGVGKTALANQMAHELEPDFPDGVILIDMPSSESMTMLSQIASDLGDHDLSSYHGLNSRSQAFRDILDNKRALIILDGAVSYREIEPFLPHTPSTTAIIVTTRRRSLDITHTAHPLHLEPFDLEEALELFANILGEEQVQRVEVKTPLEKVAEYSGRLPLALSIAAGQIKEWGSNSAADYLALLQHEGNVLNHLREESRSVWLTFETSYKQLEESQDQQIFFAALGAFAGQDFEIDAAAYVTRQGKLRAKDLLIKLRNLSLLEESTTNRFRLHDLLRSFARSKQVGVSAARRMVEYYAGYAAEHGSDIPALSREVSNIWAALDVAGREGMAESIFSLTFPYARFLVNDGQFDEAQKILEFALPLARDHQNTGAIWGSYDGLGRTAAYQGDFALAEKHFRASLAAARDGDYAIGVCDALQNISAIKLYQQQLPEAKEALLEGLALARKIDYTARIAPLLSNLASLETQLGNWLQAKGYLEQALIVARSSDDLYNLVNMLSNLSATELELREYATAEDHLTEALEIAEEMGNNELLVRTLRNIAELHRKQNHAQSADDYYQQAMDIVRYAGNQPLLFSILNDWGVYLFERHAYEQAKKMYQELDKNVAPEGFPEFACNAKFGLARITAMDGNFETARFLAQEALSLCEDSDEELARVIRGFLSGLPYEDS